MYANEFKMFTLVSHPVSTENLNKRTRIECQLEEEKGFYIFF